MAVYIYECPEHGQFDVFKSMERMEEPEKCPECEKICERNVLNRSFSIGIPQVGQTDFPFTGGRPQ